MAHIRVSALAASLCLSLAIAGCSSGGDDGAGSSTDNAAAKTSPAKSESKVNPESKGSKRGARKGPTPAADVPGRSPGVKASEPRWVGQYATQVSRTQAQRLGAPSGTQGPWTLVLLRGAYNLSPGATLVGGSLRVSGDRMVFRQRGGCDIPKPSKQPKPQTAADRKLGPAGTYRWRLRGRSLSFAAVGDRCAARKRQLTSLQWQLQLKRRRR